MNPPLNLSRHTTPPTLCVGALELRSVIDSLRVGFSACVESGIGAERRDAKVVSGFSLRRVAFAANVAPHSPRLFTRRPSFLSTAVCRLKPLTTCAPSAATALASAHTFAATAATAFASACTSAPSATPAERSARTAARSAAPSAPTARTAAASARTSSARGTLADLREFPRRSRGCLFLQRGSLAAKSARTLSSVPLSLAARTAFLPHKPLIMSDLLIFSPKNNTNQ